MAEGQRLDLQERLRQRIGRPSRVTSVSIRFTEEETAALSRLALVEGKTLREWSREALLTRLSDTEPDPAFTEIVATRILLNNILKRLACGELLTPQSFQAELDSVRAAKHGAARELKQQYAATGRQQ